MTATTTLPTVFYGSKAGQGTSTIAAAFAVLLAQSTGESVDLATRHVDTVSALLGASADHRYRVEVTDRIAVTIPAAVEAGRLVVTDLGTVSDEEEVPAGRRLLVTRPCYLALRAAMRSSLRPDGIVLLDEPGRSLTARDVSECLGVPIVATVPVDPAIARTVDAGLLASRVPTMLADAVSPLLRTEVRA